MSRPLILVFCLWLIIALLLGLLFEFDSIDTAEFAARQGVPFAALSAAAFLWLASYPCYQYLYWRTYSYDMDHENIYIRKGVAAKRQTILPFSRITDVYLDQDLLDVVLGLYDLHISTPTVESGKFAHIDGLSWYGAARLRRLLLSKINRAHLKAVERPDVKAIPDIKRPEPEIARRAAS
jgi:membrane protein YdbS with pleckstrin-like domain